MTQPWWPGPSGQPTASSSGEPPPWSPQQPVGPADAPWMSGTPTGAPWLAAAPWMPPPGGTRPATPAAATQPWQPQPQPQPQPWQTGQPAPAPRGQNPVRAAAVTTGGTAPQPSAEPWVVGLGILTFLLVAAGIAFAATVVRSWVLAWGLSVDGCLDAGRDWECLVNDTSRTQVLLPLIAVAAALALARGAAVERRQRRGIGYLYALLGFGALLAAWTVGSA